MLFLLTLHNQKQDNQPNPLLSFRIQPVFLLLQIISEFLFLTPVLLIIIAIITNADSNSSSEVKFLLLNFPGITKILTLNYLLGLFGVLMLNFLVIGTLKRRFINQYLTEALKKTYYYFILNAKSEKEIYHSIGHRIAKISSGFSYLHQLIAREILCFFLISFVTMHNISQYYILFIIFLIKFITSCLFLSNIISNDYQYIIPILLVILERTVQKSDVLKEQYILYAIYLYLYLLSEPLHGLLKEARNLAQQIDGCINHLTQDLLDGSPLGITYESKTVLWNYNQISIRSLRNLHVHIVAKKKYFLQSDSEIDKELFFQLICGHMVVDKITYYDEEASPRIINAATLQFSKKFIFIKDLPFLLFNEGAEQNLKVYIKKITDLPLPIDLQKPFKNFSKSEKNKLLLCILWFLSQDAQLVILPNSLVSTLSSEEQLIICEKFNEMPITIISDCPYFNDRGEKISIFNHEVKQKR